jgi:uncharacterized protein YueI
MHDIRFKMISREKASSDTGVLHIDWIVEKEETHIPSFVQFELGIQLPSTSLLAISV